MAKGIVRAATRARDAADREIAGIAESGGMYASGMASEGYAGGYRDAMNDVLVALNGGVPNTRFWRG